jgi:hypothetical protein
MSKPEYKKIIAIKQGELSDEQKIRLTDSLKDKNIQRIGGTNENPTYGYWDGTKMVTVNTSTGAGTNTTVKPTGNIVPVILGDKTVYLDQSSSAGFENAITQANTAGSPIFFANGYRDQVETIKSMANKQGIAFNTNNPAETAQKLRTAGHQVADPGKSNHETGMAIDVYADSSMKS